MVHGRRYGRLYDVTDVFTTQRVTRAAKEMNRKLSVTDNAFFLSPTLYSFFLIYLWTRISTHTADVMHITLQTAYVFKYSSNLLHAGLVRFFIYFSAYFWKNIEDFHMQSFCVYIVAHDGVVKMSEHAEYGECLTVPNHGKSSTIPLMVHGCPNAYRCGDTCLRFGVAVTRWFRSTQLLYIEPG